MKDKLLLIVALAAAAAAAPALAEEPADAVQAFLAQRYAVAYGRFAQLADEGDKSAALMALTLVSNGPSVFGTDWSATPGQLRRWSELAMQDLRDRAGVIAAHEHDDDHRPRAGGDHPAIVVQRLGRGPRYDYASKFYPHPAWMYLLARSPHGDEGATLAQGTARDRKAMGR